jgi:hypothetical protein
MKRTVIALIFCTLANICGAQVLDAAALARALKCGLDFKTGVKPVCTLLEFADGKTWLITSISDAVYLSSASGPVDAKRILTRRLERIARNNRIST